MIIYKQGDVIKALENGEINLLPHGCNCRKVMGSGIAKSLATKYPKILEYDRNFPPILEARLGRIVKVPIDKEKFIINCYTQLNYGAGLQVDYNAIEKCMKALNNLLNLSDKYVLGMPQIGAGRGGGDWKKIETIINNEIEREIYVFIYK